MADISPKRARRKAFLRPFLSLFTGLAIGLVILAVVYVPRAGWTSYDVTTGQNSGYHDLTSHRYDMPVDQATRVSAQLASITKGWRVVHLDAAAGEMQAEARILPLLPPQVVTLKTRPSGPDNRYSEVLIRSRSTWGIGGDFGINAHHIRTLQTLMDDKLPRAE